MALLVVVAPPGAYLFAMAHISFTSPPPVRLLSPLSSLSTTSSYGRHAIPNTPLSTRRSKRSRAHPTMGSVNTPDYFSTKWYKAPLLDTEQSSHHIQNNDTQTDHHIVDVEAGLMVLLDYPTDATTSPAHQMVCYIQRRLQQTTQYSHQPVIDLRSVLSSAMRLFGAPAGFSALVLHTCGNVMRSAWIGACGFVLIRDDAIAYRSYGDEIGVPALEHLIQDSTPRHVLPDHQPSGGYALTGVPNQPPPMCVDAASIHTDFLQLDDNDLVIGGSDGLFSNMSEKQMLAFVRPVPDAEDSTLAIANHTCLGSWRYDDVQFIAYYLAIIATNFATAPNSRPHLTFPFPPSPHLDDVTVLCAACTCVR